VFNEKGLLLCIGFAQPPLTQEERKTTFWISLPLRMVAPGKNTEKVICSFQGLRRTGRGLYIQPIASEQEVIFGKRLL